MTTHLPELVADFLANDADSIADHCGVDFDDVIALTEQIKTLTTPKPESTATYRLLEALHQSTLDAVDMGLTGLALMIEDAYDDLRNDQTLGECDGCGAEWYECALNQYSADDSSNPYVFGGAICPWCDGREPHPDNQ